ncbi:MAG: hypothetical protein WCT53_04310 [Candidatus Gracilibacteria bacterium]
MEGESEPANNGTGDDLEGHLEWLRGFERHEELWGESGKKSLVRLDEVRREIERLIFQRAKQKSNGQTLNLDTGTQK